MKTINRVTGEIEERLFGDLWHEPVEACKLAPVTTDSITEDTYNDPQKQIQDMMIAGQNLLAIRKARYDSEMGMENQEDLEEDIPEDPTRSPNVDIVDVFRLAEKATQHAKELRAASEKAAADAAEAEKKASIQAAAEQLLAQQKINSGTK